MWDHIGSQQGTSSADSAAPRTPTGVPSDVGGSGGGGFAVTGTSVRLLLRVHSAQSLPHSSMSQGVYCKLYLGDTPMIHGSQKSLFGGKRAPVAEDVTGDTAAHDEGSSHRVFRTRTVPHDTADQPAVWDEHFDVLVLDPMTDILSVRVKSQHRLYPTVLGACALHLKRLKVGRMVDRSFPLIKGSREVASLRLQLVLAPLEQNVERTKGVLQTDIKTALAATHAADDAIERLVAVATAKQQHAASETSPQVAPVARDLRRFEHSPVFSA